MIARKTRRARLTLHSLEGRDVPANFEIANGDTAGLIAAINACNFNNEADTINLAVNGTYTFASAADAAEGGSALPTILRDTSDSNTVTINGRGALVQRSTVLGTPNFRLLRIGVFPNIIGVTVNNLSFINGNAPGNNGGAVELAAGDLTVNNCTFSFNQAATGGAIYATNTSSPLRRLSINGSNFSGNQSINGAGGAVYMLGTTDVAITDSAFQTNTSSGEGGAVRVQTSNATTTVTRSLFAGNTANGGNGGGAIFIQGNTSVTDTTIRDNMCTASSGGGGGLWVQTGSTGFLTMSGCTLSGNRVNNSTASGGAIFNQAANLTVVNSTIHNNRAGSGGGLAFVNGSTTGSIKHTTITDNSVFFGLASGGGVAIFGNGVLSIGNSIIAGNTLETGGSGPDIGGSINSTGYNLIQSTAGATINGTTTGNIYNTSPNLGTLQPNGGLTATRLPNAGSPVVNAGDPKFMPPPATDQRGAGYARVVDGRLDIGAVERTAPRVASTVVNGGAAQRSRVTSLTVTFNTLVSFVTTPGAAFTLMRNSDNAAVMFTATANVVGGVTVVTLDSFDGMPTQFGSLADGRYTLTAIATQITASGLPLDGNGDGLPGDNYSFGDAEGLFRYFGDANGDRRVDIADFGLLSTSYGLHTGGTGFLAYFDFNNDGTIDIADFGQFAFRMFTMLP